MSHDNKIYVWQKTKNRRDKVLDGIMEAGAHDYILKNNLAELTPAIDRALCKTKNRQ